MADETVPRAAQRRRVTPLLARVTRHADLQQFQSLTAIRSGRHVIHDGGLPIDLDWEDRRSRVTVVCLHAAITAETRLPFFSGRRVTSGLPANRLFIADPSLMLSPDLDLAWYAGSSGQRTQQALVAILSTLRATRPAHERFVFFGASGGGFASLYLAAQFPGSVAVVVNPQTSIGGYYPVPVAAFASTCFGVRGKDPLQRIPAEVIHDLNPLYAQPVGATVFYLQNLQDPYHLERHVRPFRKTLHPDNEVWWLAGDARGSGHVAPPKQVIAQALAAAVSSNAAAAAGRLGMSRDWTRVSGGRDA